MIPARTSVVGGNPGHEHMRGAQAGLSVQGLWGEFKHTHQCQSQNISLHTFSHLKCQFKNLTYIPKTRKLNVCTQVYGYEGKRVARKEELSATSMKATAHMQHQPLLSMQNAAAVGVAQIQEPAPAEKYLPMSPKLSF